MVNHGVSRACEACRKRRKKCDEARPACKRCLQSGRICFGYREDADLLFRNYAPPPKKPTAGIRSWSPNVDDEYLERNALDTFVAEYVVESADKQLSRGFLEGMPCLLADAGASSDLACAATIVALAGIGNRLGRPDLIQRTTQKYGELLHSFHASLSQSIDGTSLRSLMTAVLLGLYEIISSNDIHPGQHVTHVRGVGAILSSKSSPFDLSAAIQLFQLANPLLLEGPLMQPQTPGVLCSPISHHSLQNLDAILIQCNPLFNRANALLAEPASTVNTLLQLQEDALVLDHAFSCWGSSQSDEWIPKTIGTVSDAAARESSCPYCWPGPVDTYLDFYVAAVWNTYRKTHLMLVEILIRCAQRLACTDVLPDLEQQAQTLTAGITASIPYHLSPDMQQYLEAISAGSGNIPIGRPVGGLLLLHPLYVIAHCSIVSLPLRTHVSECLAWIGKHMGIGQASLLSKPLTTLPFQRIVEGHILIWAGMLLQPA